nr:E3 ubiquitin-protein ligase bre1 [Exophiala xenobiotica]
MARNKLRQLSNKLQQSKAENKSLRIRIQELAGDLQMAREELETVDHLRCGICMHSFKNVLISCGHCFCRGCLTLWPDGPDKGCPACRQSVEERDIQDIYLGAGSQTPDVPEGDDDVTDVISLASDSE